MITSQAYISIKNKQLNIQSGDNNIHVPVDDIACVVLSNPQITITQSVLTSCAQNNVVLINCDDKHTPNGIYHSYLTHYRCNYVLQQQMMLTRDFKQNIWNKLLAQKIQNQAESLAKVHLEMDIVKTLQQFAKEVAKNGDSQKYESQASRLYFRAMFGKDFIRITKLRPKLQHKNIQIHQDINAMLNFGYTIVRSLICRSIVAYGLLPILGVFHDNNQNAYNLADDFIEPYRAYIDWYVYSVFIQVEEAGLTIAIKAKIVDVLNHIVIIDNKKTTLLNSVDIMVKSYINAINKYDYHLLKLPQLPIDIIRTNIS